MPIVTRPVKVALVTSESSPTFADIAKGLTAFAKANPNVVNLVEVVFAEVQPADLTLQMRISTLYLLEENKDAKKPDAKVTGTSTSNSAPAAAKSRNVAFQCGTPAASRPRTTTFVLS